MRIVPETLLRERNADEAQHLYRLLTGFIIRHLLVQPQAFRQLLTDTQYRIQRGHRILEDHADLTAANLAHLTFAEAKQFPALHRDAALLNIRILLRQQLHDGMSGHALAAAGLADDPECLAMIDGETHIADGMYRPAIGLETYRQIFYFNNWLFLLHVDSPSLSGASSDQGHHAGHHSGS